MGGGGAMRAAAAKMGGLGIVSGALQGMPVRHPAERSMRKASVPVSALVKSSSSGTGDLGAVSVQRPSWEMDDWEFAGGEEDVLVESGEPMARVVFGAAPSFKEAKEATEELKDAIEKVYLSSPSSPDCEVSHPMTQGPCLALLSNSAYTETKPSVTMDTTVAPSVPRHAFQAFKYLAETPAAQNVVASIASDPNVWDAVLQNSALMEFMNSQKTSAPSPTVDFNYEESTVDSEGHKSQVKVEELSSLSKPGNFADGLKDIFQNFKITVVQMVSSMSDFLHNIFGPPAVEKHEDADGNSQPKFMDKTLGASLMGLAVMVILVVTLKRG